MITGTGFWIVSSEKSRKEMKSLSRAWKQTSPSAGEGRARRPIRTVGAVQDITERKNAEIKLQEYAGTQAVLLSDVNHRVKNNLAIIIGMLHWKKMSLKAEGRPRLSLSCRIWRDVSTGCTRSTACFPLPTGNRCS